MKLLPPNVYTSCDTTAVMKNMDTPADVMPNEMNGSAVGNTRIPSGIGRGQQGNESSRRATGEKGHDERAGSQ